MSFEEEDNQVKRYYCDTWEDFVREIKRERVIPCGSGGFAGGAHVIYRGHSNPDWLLASTLERNLRFKFPPSHPNAKSGYNLRTANGVGWYNEQYEKIFQTFLENAAGLPDLSNCTSDVDKWAIGCHYGLLSPYLDWSLSPFVAAFFAFEEIYKEYAGIRTGYRTDFDGNVTVWAIRFWIRIDDDEVFEVLQPASPHATRPRAQRGVYTRLTSKDHVDLESYFKDRSIAHFLERYDINLKDAPTAIRDFKLMNISYLTLFPDISGAAWDANMLFDIARDHLVLKTGQQYLAI